MSIGAVTLAELKGGTLSGLEMDLFQSQWLRERLSDMSRLCSTVASRVDPHTSKDGAEIDPHFAAVLAAHVLRRMITTVRAAQHGGTLVIVPQQRAPALVSDGHHMRLKYAFIDEEPRRRIASLVGTIMRELSEFKPRRQRLGWDAYESAAVGQLVELDEALFEVAHLLADFTHVDGTVLITDSLEVLGFGVEIAGELPEVARVARALDVEGTEREWVRTDRVGTRHRSAYRLCETLRDALALVVSQDGALRFVRWHVDAVTYWEQLATGPWEI